MAKRILVFAGDQYHPAGVVMDGLERAIPSTEFALAPDGPLTEIDPTVDAVVLAKLNVASPTDSSPMISAGAGSILADLVASGKGLLVVHAGTVGYRVAPIIRELVGGSFERHPEACSVSIEPTGESPLTAGATNFAIHDEHYFVATDEGLEIFLHSRSEHGSQPAGWTKLRGKGRICVLTPGHFAEAWSHASFKLLLSNALSWVTHG